MSKIRIIIFIFLVAVVFFALQYTLSYMSHTKKRESFTADYFDEVENFEDKPSTDLEKLKALVLDEINATENLQPADKGKLLTVLLDDKFLESLADKTNKKEAVQTKIAEHMAKPPVVPPKVTADDEEKMLPKMKDYYDSGSETLVKIGDKLSSALSHLDALKGSLSDMRTYIAGKETYEAKVPELPKLPTIEGFENIRAFAMYS